MASSCLSFAARRIEGSSSAAGGVTVGAAVVVVFGAGAAAGGVTTDATDVVDARTLPSGGDAVGGPSGPTRATPPARARSAHLGEVHDRRPRGRRRFQWSFLDVELQLGLGGFDRRLHRFPHGRGSPTLAPTRPFVRGGVKRGGGRRRPSYAVASNGAGASARRTPGAAGRPASIEAAVPDIDAGLVLGSLERRRGRRPHGGRQLVVIVRSSAARPRCAGVSIDAWTDGGAASTSGGRSSREAWTGGAGAATGDSRPPAARSSAFSARRRAISAAPRRCPGRARATEADGEAVGSGASSGGRLRHDRRRRGGRRAGAASADRRRRRARRGGDGRRRRRGRRRGRVGGGSRRALVDGRRRARARPACRCPSRAGWTWDSWRSSPRRRGASAHCGSGA